MTVRSIDPVSLPRVDATLSLGEYDYRYEYVAAGRERAVVTNDFRRCVHCGTADAEITYCDNCGSLNCGDHVRTERLEGEPVCTGCAVTERFALKTKYFFDEGNLEAFREEYEGMALHEKARENVPLAIGFVLAAILLALLLVGSVGL
ncbi:hypothetical protein EA472_05125 [Natrarchaeobius oligotrophus]|uniref:Restriction endonuclease n=1 Tax=Natrarchaeobius chitinivorans TaxID=1679083 RepID=A0A3N6MUR6_NATCH|nr:hypothetical protein EA472_05125 [Natrarchaeobius chitinivorans]